MNSLPMGNRRTETNWVLRTPGSNVVTPELKLLPDLRLAVDELSAQLQELSRRGLRSAFHTVPEVFEEPSWILGSRENGSGISHGAGAGACVPGLGELRSGKALPVVPAQSRRNRPDLVPFLVETRRSNQPAGSTLWRHGNSFASTAQRV